MQSSVAADPRVLVRRRPIVLHAAQWRFVESTARLRGFVGGRGAGKSFVGAYDLLRRARAGRFYMVVSPTLPILKDTALPSFLELAERLGRPVRLRRTDFRGWFATADGGRARVTLRGADDPQSLRGPNLSGAWLD
ncbi:MAG: hypothetical protein ACRDD1_15655, partial [Planctomycetia bacterium]